MLRAEALQAKFACQVCCSCLQQCVQCRASSVNTEVNTCCFMPRSAGCREISACRRTTSKQGCSIYLQALRFVPQRHCYAASLWPSWCFWRLVKTFLTPAQHDGIYARVQQSIGQVPVLHSAQGLLLRVTVTSSDGVCPVEVDSAHLGVRWCWRRRSGGSVGEEGTQVFGSRSAGSQLLNVCAALSL